MENSDLSLELEDSSVTGQKAKDSVIVGRILTTKPIRKQGVISTLKAAWRTKKDYVVSDWGQNTYGFRFKQAEDADKILSQSPWFVMGNPIILQKWDHEKTIDELDFNFCPFWVQIHGLPRNYFNEQNIKTIGKSFGRLISHEGFGEDAPLLCFLRLRLELDVNRPLRTGFFASVKGGPSRWATIKYERLGNFCFNCGRLGHMKEECKDDNLKGSKVEFGPQLRAGGKQTISTKYSGEQSNVKSGFPTEGTTEESGQRSPTEETVVRDVVGDKSCSRTESGSEKMGNVNNEWKNHAWPRITELDGFAPSHVWSERVKLNLYYVEEPLEMGPISQTGLNLSNRGLNEPSPISPTNNETTLNEFGDQSISEINLSQVFTRLRLKRKTVEEDSEAMAIDTVRSTKQKCETHLQPVSRLQRSMPSSQRSDMNPNSLKLYVGQEGKKTPNQSKVRRFKSIKKGFVHPPRSESLTEDHKPITDQGALNYLHILPSRKRPFTILQDISGIIKPGRMTLLLGPPSSGKTTLLLALSGKLDKDLKVAGIVTYNGHKMDEFIPQRTSAYISQRDLHLRELTVRETMAFSARCQGVGPRYDMVRELSRREKENNIKPDADLDVFMKAAALDGQEANVLTDYVIKLLGLDICADTLVGDEMVRGISGGQKRRLTTGEMLVGPARALFMDDISTGLDSSTTFQIVSAIKQSTHIFQGTVLVSLLQPAPETYDLFDDIILLSDHQIVYQGPREYVLEFFEEMGFKCPERKGVADFLQEVTSRKDQEQYWAKRDDTYTFITVSQFAEAFKSFLFGRTLEEELCVPFEKSNSHPAALTTDKYGINKKQLLRALISRELLLMKRNAIVYIFSLTQIIVLSILMMTVFLRTKMHKDTVEDGVTYMGAIFYIVAVVLFIGLMELALTIMRLPVFFKQRDLLFFPPWAYAIPNWIIKLPVAIAEVTILVFVIYYGVGFDPNFGRLIKMIIVLLGISQAAGGIYRLIAAIARDMTVAMPVGIFTVLIFLVLGGFVLSKDDVADWLIWGYWISPLMYAQNAVVVNEFLGHSWNKVDPNTNEPLGEMILRARGLFTEAKWYWIGVGALLIYIFSSNILFSVALTYLNSKDKPQALLSEENTIQENASRTGYSVELSPRRNSPSGTERSKSSTSSGRDVSSQFNRNSTCGMALPFEPLCITFDEIKYSVDMPQAMRAQGITQERLILLRGISGAFRPGVLTALMGVSGAGKTTLMDVLAGRKTGGYIEGAITISGYPKKQETFARISGYCEQTDIHSPNVTVYESLQFSSWLRLSPDLDAATRKMFVDEVMELVELTPLKGALVGLPGVNGLSTEQRKRLTIAVELVANPSIIFMDEPTSGLDARAAAIVMRTVRNTVDTGRTVVCTIHQPSIDIFDAFDELFLLKLGGEEIYAGPVGRHSCHLIRYFESINGVSKIKDGYNPATWMLEVTSQGQEAIMGIDFAQLYKNSELYRRNKELIKELSKPRPGSQDLHFPTQYSQSFFTQCVACLWKQHLSYWRNPSYSAVRLLFTTIIALSLGTIFYNLGSKKERSQDLFNAMGSMFITVLLLGTQNASSIQPVVDTGRTVFYRERAAGMYSAMPYALGQVLIELPYVLVQNSLYSLIVYSMMGYEWTAAKFFYYFFIMYFTFLYFTFFGMMTVGITPNQHIAAVISSGFYSIWTLFSGFIIPKPRIPIWWRWVYNICPFAWSLSGLLTSQYGDFHNKIETGETVEEFLERYFDFRYDFLGYNVLILFGIALIFGFTFAYSIRSFNFQNR